MNSMSRLLAPIMVLAGSILSASPDASAGSATQTIQVPIRAQPLSISVAQVEADCSWSAGQVVFVPSVAGGDGNAITWSLTQPGSDFAVNASTGAVSVGASGIAAANCGKTESVALTASQN